MGRQHSWLLLLRELIRTNLVLLARLFDCTALSRLGLLKKQVRLRALPQEVTQVNSQLALHLRGEGQQI